MNAGDGSRAIGDDIGLHTLTISRRERNGGTGRPLGIGIMLPESEREMAEEMRAHARERIAHVQIYPDPHTLAGIEAFAPVLEILDRE